MGKELFVHFFPCRSLFLPPSLPSEAPGNYFTNFLWYVLFTIRRCKYSITRQHVRPIYTRKAGSWKRLTFPHPIPIPSVVSQLLEVFHLPVKRNWVWTRTGIPYPLMLNLTMLIWCSSVHSQPLREQENKHTVMVLPYSREHHLPKTRDEA